MHASYRSHHLALLNLLFELDSGSICSVVCVWWLSSNQFNLIVCRNLRYTCKQAKHVPHIGLNYRPPQIKLPNSQENNRSELPFSRFACLSSYNFLYGGSNHHNTWHAFHQSHDRHAQKGFGSKIVQ